MRNNMNAMDSIQVIKINDHVLITISINQSTIEVGPCYGRTDKLLNTRRQGTDNFEVPDTIIRSERDLFARMAVKK
jgi:hypothetical protein